MGATPRSAPVRGAGGASEAQAMSGHERKAAAEAGAVGGAPAEAAREGPRGTLLGPVHVSYGVDGMLHVYARAEAGGVRVAVGVRIDVDADEDVSPWTIAWRIADAARIAKHVAEGTAEAVATVKRESKVDVELDKSVVRLLAEREAKYWGDSYDVTVQVWDVEVEG